MIIGRSVSRSGRNSELGPSWSQVDPEASLAGWPAGTALSGPFFTEAELTETVVRDRDNSRFKFDQSSHICVVSQLRVGPEHRFPPLSVPRQLGPELGTTCKQPVAEVTVHSGSGWQT